jgi:zinc protease
MKRIFLLVVLGGVVLLLAVARSASAQAFDVKTHTLKNGMKILVQEDHSIPNVALYTFYRIGSRNERPGTTGISHFFEHMMFNGAKKYGPGEFDRVMEGAGGSNNAYTSQNTTVYQDWFPSSTLELIFDLEADRIRNLSFDPKVIESERGVIASERRNSVEANNQRLLSEQLWAAAFTAHAYQWPVLGWMSDIEAWTIDDLKNHFRMGYSPSNATMVVTGDVTFAEVVRLAEQYIEPIPSSAPPPPVVTKEPEQLGERRVVVRKFAQMPIVMMAYHVPETAHPDYYPLQALETILFSGQSSRMYQRLVDKDQLALSVYGGSSWAFDPTLFTITARPKAGVDPAAVEKAVYEELDRVKSDAVTDTELEKAKNILLSSFYGEISAISGRSNATTGRR